MRTKNSVFNFIVKFLSSAIVGALGIVLNYLILNRFGSDINGLWGTISQILILLTILEGGLTLSSNVALYRPYLDKDSKKVSDILSATNRVYVKIGGIITILSLILAFSAPYILVSNVDKYVISSLFLIASASLILDFFLTLKFNLMFSVGQKEYLSNFITLVFNILSQIVSIITILIGGNILAVKLVALIIPLLRMPFIIKFHRKLFPGINFKSLTPDFSIVKTAKDVIALQFASLVFGSTDMVVISTMINTSSASVYSVYNMVYSFIRTFLQAIILAPFNAFGQLYATGNIDKLSKNYKTFQFIALIAINIFITTTNILIIPFMRLYTKNIHDINYIDLNFAMLFSMTFALASIGDILSITNSTGHFKEMKNISIFTAIVNIVLSLSLVKIYGIKGVVIGTIISYLIHFSLQTYIVYKKIIPEGFYNFLIKLVLNFAISLLLTKFSFSLNLQILGYIDFAIAGLVTFSISSSIILIVNIIIDIKSTIEVYELIKNVVFKNKKKIYTQN